MFYTYKVVSYDGKKYFFTSKESLFNEIDELGYIRFSNLFCDEFKYNEGNVVYSSSEIRVYSPASGDFYSLPKNNYRNGDYVIRNYANSIVSVEELLEDYKKSRNIKAKDKWHNHYTSKWSCKKGNRARCDKKQSGLIKELSDNEIESILYGIKFRKGRSEKVRKNVLADYYHYYRIDCNKSWKDKKVPKQWQKNKHL